MSATEDAENSDLKAARAKPVQERSLAERVLVAATEGSDQPFIREIYPELLAERIQDADRTLHRRGVTLVLLMGAFVLFANANIKELEVAGAKFTDVTPIYRLLPLGIAIYYSEVLAHATLMVFQQELLTQFLRVQHPQLVENGLDFGVGPASRINMHAVLESFIRGGGATLNAISLVILIATVGFFVIAPIAFLLYAFDHLRTQYGSHNWFFGVTFVLAVAFVIEGLMWLWVYSRTKME